MENLVVGVIVALAAYFMVRRVYRNIKAQNTSTCGCGCEGSCLETHTCEPDRDAQPESRKTGPVD